MQSSTASPQPATSWGMVDLVSPLLPCGGDIEFSEAEEDVFDDLFEDVSLDTSPVPLARESPQLDQDQEPDGVDLALVISSLQRTISEETETYFCPPPREDEDVSSSSDSSSEGDACCDKAQSNYIICVDSDNKSERAGRASSENSCCELVFCCRE